MVGLVLVLQFGISRSAFNALLFFMDYKSEVKIILQLVYASINLGAEDVTINNRDKNSHPSNGEDRWSDK